MVPVVAVALWRADGCVLMQRRPEGRQHGGLWEFPGGKVEAGESAAAAAVRELAEELGVRIAPAALEPVGFAEEKLDGLGPKGWGIVILLYVCPVWEGEPVGLDAQPIAWVAAEDIAGLEMPPLDYPLARALLRHVAAPCGGLLKTGVFPLAKQGGCT